MATVPQSPRTTSHSHSPNSADVQTAPANSTAGRTRNLSHSTSPATSHLSPDSAAAPSENKAGNTRLLQSTSFSSTPRVGSLLTLAAATLDRTISGISEPRVRSRHSLSRLSVGGPYSVIGGVLPSPNNSTQTSGLTPPTPTPTPRTSTRPASIQTFRATPPSTESKSFAHPGPASSPIASPPPTPYSTNNPNSPRLPRSTSEHIDSKMHQTSSRLLRMTDDDRPFTKDFKDLFATLIVSLLPLSAHRVRLTKIEHTFLSEDAINNLGSLKFSQSNRMPDPKDPSRIVTTTTTTTFSMAKDMARSICQRFLEARFIESADGKYQTVYTMKGSVWQLTPKGICILDRFCARNGIQQKQVDELKSNTLSHLVILERDPQSDKLLTDRGTIEVLFRRFIGTNGPNVKNSVSSADSDSLSDYRDGLTGVKMANERKVAGKLYKETFTGKAASDWLMDCSTTVDRRETVEIASLFVQYELMEPIQVDRTHMAQYPGNNVFQPTKHALYQVTAKGKDLVAGLVQPRGRESESDGGPSGQRSGIARDSNTQRLEKILADPALRLLFRENLRETHCEENLSFYVDVDEFVRQCRLAIRAAQKNPNNAASMDGIKEIMAQAYGIYNAFLAPGSPCELNIDHQLRNNLATRMTKAVGQDVAMIDTLHEVTQLFEDAQNAVFKLMASDSVPKFLRSPKYEQTLKNYDFDAAFRVPERSQSRSKNRK